MTRVTEVTQKEMARRTGLPKALGYAFPKKGEILIRKELKGKDRKKVLAHEAEHISKGEEGPFWGAVAGGLIAGAAGLLGSKKQADASKDATDAQTQAAQAQIDYARESRDLARADQYPYQQAGYTALDALMSMTGLGKAAPRAPAAPPTPPTPSFEPDRPPISIADEWGSIRRGVRRGGSQYQTNPRYAGGSMAPHYNVSEVGPENVFSSGNVMRYAQPRTIGLATGGYVAPTENPGGVEGGYNFMTDPGYEFRRQEGQRAVERGAAARGGLLSGGAGKALQKYGQGFASNEYSNVYNRISNIAGLASIPNQIGSNAALQYGNQAGIAAGNAGYAQASGYTNQGNIWGNAIQGIGQIAQDLPWAKIFGSSGGGSAPPGAISVGSNGGSGGGGMVGG